ncbi:acylphosphatase [Actinobacillus succinogenes]|uniref:Acylphosphatase n=1 Tax=Actinobacillus succinogenes (strain ATCC 55618 / DSM 22257 / CCUG 43843 / 130Z) TaxID=339671 RepID=ACYP_ACTSZ|nr:acylphosphatase [Actinobacillus succinogenes]A6VN24.1 RecName: Full=Acylphosphatase; AltName: Full=Acylphosphate phosphohydrolase [Actinobacillus succinogenes 130Z]ABR74371.1 acylphosphatase [Actinobacillus succinogenes 130Z]PHI39209.1 acylphosphatase [Actinobacillus succinogenes]
MIQRQFTVYGCVQGVGFRFFTAREANKLGIQGYVKNQADGSVRVVAAGSDRQVAAFRDWLEQGPPTAEVTNLLEQEYTGGRVFSDFTIER